MRSLSLTVLIVSVLTVPLFVFAQGGEGLLTYTPIVDLPGNLSNQQTGSLSSLVNILYALSISVAGLLAVIKIIVAGLKWMLTDVIPSKSEAKKDIQNALFGLIIVISAVLIITVINPNILGGG